MDPTAKMARSRTHYHSRGNDPTNVPVAREQRIAERFYKLPNTKVPNNTIVGNQVQQELMQNDNAQVYENPYRDSRGMNPPGTGVNFQMKPPMAPAALAFSPQNYEETGTIGDSRWAYQVNGNGGVLDVTPMPSVINPGLAATVSRYPGTGQPQGLPLPANSSTGFEDLAVTQGLYPPSMDLMPQSQVIGDPRSAQLPRAGRDTRPTRKGMTPAMPRPF